MAKIPADDVERRLLELEERIAELKTREPEDVYQDATLAHEIARLELQVANTRLFLEARDLTREAPAKEAAPRLRTR